MTSNMPEEQYALKTKNIFMALLKGWKWTVLCVIIGGLLGTGLGIYSVRRPSFSKEGYSAAGFPAVEFLEKSSPAENLDTLNTAVTELQQYIHTVLQELSPQQDSAILVQFQNYREALYQFTMYQIDMLSLELETNPIVLPWEKAYVQLQLEHNQKQLQDQLREAEINLEILKQIPAPMGGSDEGYSTLLESVSKISKQTLELQKNQQQLAALQERSDADLNTAYEGIQQKLKSFKNELETLSDAIYDDILQVCKAKGWNILADYGLDTNYPGVYQVVIADGHVEDSPASLMGASIVTGVLLGLILGCYFSLVSYQRGKSKIEKEKNPI